MTDTQTHPTLTSWHLARLADVTNPDRHDGIGFEPTFEPPQGYEASAGATFLRSVENDTLERIDEGSWDEDGDAAHEIADGAVPIYTHTLWETFVDLAAYNEDPSELMDTTNDMNQAASVCLYMIAERLARAIADNETDVA